jgi:EAL and modified HD-GYP domain-containing signal transduction protein
VPDLDSKVLVSRQPVLNRFSQVPGYRVSYAQSDGDALSLFDTVLSVIGLEWLVGETMAHLPISRDMLLTLGTPPVRPDRVQLRIAYEDAADPGMRPIFEEAAARGYTLELDSLPGPDFDVDLLELFGVVEIDFQAWREQDISAVLPLITGRFSMPLAAGLRDHDERDRADALGFTLFTGDFFGTPKIVTGRKIPVGDIKTLASVVELQSSGTTLEQVVEVVSRDLGLSVKLLRYINSAYFGMAAKVGSIHDAAMKLGSRGVARWALTVTITGAPSISRELAVVALTRARLCEMLAKGEKLLDSGELFTLGLLSAADAVFGRPLNTIVPELPLSDKASQALLHHAGAEGEILRAALAYERGDFGNSMLQRVGRGHGRSYRNALGWAQEALTDAA